MNTRCVSYCNIQDSFLLGDRTLSVTQCTGQSELLKALPPYEYNANPKNNPTGHLDSLIHSIIQYFHGTVKIRVSSAV